MFIVNNISTEDKYVEYKCSACRKEIKKRVAKYIKCNKIFMHPGCVINHRVYNKNCELVPCSGPYEQFLVDSEKEEETKKLQLCQRAAEKG